MFKKSSFFKHFYDLTGPKYAEKYEDSESGIKSIHFLAKMTKRHDFMSKFWLFFRHFLGQPFFGHWWGAFMSEAFLGEAFLGDLVRGSN